MIKKNKLLHNMEEASEIEVELTGGPMDGDTIILSPKGSVSPPHQLCYLGSAKEQASWMIYESEIIQLWWTSEPQKVKFNFIGWYSLARDQLLKK